MTRNTQPQPTAARIAKHRAAQRALGRKRVEYWLTESEKTHLDAELEKMRNL